MVKSHLIVDIRFITLHNECFKGGCGVVPKPWKHHSFVM